ncbi:sensor histidine kinase [Longibaculum muris]|uniref:sensor histidine kinase n=1 Tax=Longibaculum muris TaxID=1796628 RepID=UPI0018A016F1|nr:HAMP domain-containing sensor histidine kinase [Longibaculum muris]
MKHRISAKIFIILMVGFMLILGISAKLNIEAQKNLYLSWIREQYNYKQITESITDLLDEYGINQKDIFQLLKNKDFQKKLQTICPGYWNYIFICQKDNENQNQKIQYYTLGQDFVNNYLVLYSNQIKESQCISIESLNDNQKAELLSLLKSGLYTNEYNDYSNIDVKYTIENNHLVYFECQNILYGQKTKNYQKGRITSFCINNQLQTVDPLKQIPILVDVDSMKESILTLPYYYGADGSYVSYMREIGEQTFFLTNMGDDKALIYIVSVVENVQDYVLARYIEENNMLYFIALICAILISLILSYMIAKPIKKVEKVALKIAHNDFDETLHIKSKDEIGSLAKSVNHMSHQLKQTIQQLNDEIEHVKKLESLRKDFINQFTHEMKTPLGIINGYGELIEEAESDEEREKYIAIIHRETKRINQLIQSMLSLSRLEAGKVEMNIEEFDLEDSVTEIIDEYEVLFMKKNIVVKVNNIQSRIKGDKKLLETVIHNFLSNAIKHTTDNGQIEVTIDKGCAVYNSGSLIDEEEIEDIWYTFVTHDHQGSGLGLAICQSILEMHGYDYGVKNLETGVQFYFQMKKECE